MLLRVRDGGGAHASRGDGRGRDRDGPSRPIGLKRIRDYLSNICAGRNVTEYEHILSLNLIYVPIPSQNIYMYRLSKGPIRTLRPWLCVN